MKRVLILGAAGRDFHNFNVLFRHDPSYDVVAFTATQIPDIAGRRYPRALAGDLYPAGIPIVTEDEMEKIIRAQQIDVAVFSYSDVSHMTLMHLASRAVAAGADFWLFSAAHTELAAKVPVVSVCAVRTGCGKSPISREVIRLLKAQGWRPVAVRHPMPYGDLTAQRAQRFATMDDLVRQQCTIEEREDYEPHIAEHTTVYAGVDYEEILRQAENEGDVILWDGGNNDTPFYVSDLEIVVADPHRPGHEMSYYPGEVNLRRAQVIEGGEALHRLVGQIAVGHGMAHHHRAPSHLPQLGGDPPRHRALAATGAHGADGNHRHPRHQLGVVATGQPEVGAGGHRPRGQMHQVLMRNIAVGKHHNIDGVLVDQVFQLRLLDNGNAIRVKRPGQWGRVAPVGDIGDLGGGKGHHAELGTVAKQHVEVVEIAPGGAQDQNPLHAASRPPRPFSADRGGARSSVAGGYRSDSERGHRRGWRGSEMGCA